MEALIILAVTFVLLWFLFIRPQQRRARAHHQLIAELEEGDDVILTAGIYGRITELGPEDMTLEVAPDTELRVARQAVLRRVETGPAGGGALGEAADDHGDAETDQRLTGSDGSPAPSDPA
ncbi:MAG TPA: preprotein translocase subunit YajC [Acidimicrobiales bacterium]|jgi:preprotein translocase subunit YajC|nr:preprotein translocase subunit YajC [Acidimicrobiales bacterium]